MMKIRGRLKQQTELSAQEVTARCGFASSREAPERPDRRSIAKKAVVGEIHRSTEDSLLEKGKSKGDVQRSDGGESRRGIVEVQGREKI